MLLSPHHPGALQQIQKRRDNRTTQPAVHPSMCSVRNRIAGEHASRPKEPSQEPQPQTLRGTPLKENTASRQPEQLSTAKEIITRIDAQLQSKERVTVGISGFGGSGKSYLAKQLQKWYALATDQIISIDNLYSATPNGPGIFDQSDWTLLRRILTDVQAGQRLRYQGRTYRGQTIEIDEALPGIVIVEGIRLFQPSTLEFFDERIWINCPQAFAMSRAKERDRGQGENEAEIARWDTDWGPKDSEYFDTYRPDRSASILYDGYH